MQLAQLVLDDAFIKVIRPNAPPEKVARFFNRFDSGANLDSDSTIDEIKADVNFGDWNDDVPLEVYSRYIGQLVLFSIFPGDSHYRIALLQFDCGLLQYDPLLEVRQHVVLSLVEALAKIMLSVIALRRPAPTLSSLAPVVDEIEAVAVQSGVRGRLAEALADLQEAQKAVGHLRALEERSVRLAKQAEVLLASGEVDTLEDGKMEVERMESARISVTSSGGIQA